MRHRHLGELFVQLEGDYRKINFNHNIPVQMSGSFVKQCVVLPHKLAANNLRTGGFHDHDFDSMWWSNLE